jgi:leader peptidase (prepilin peptidase)/N-methyltransferase
MDDAQLEALAVSPAALGAAFVLGLLWGSFANVCIYRWPPTAEHPNGRSVVAPGSHCGACGKPVRWYDNVPILAWLWLRGRCRDCGVQFSARYILIEALTGVLFATVWWFAVVARAPLEALDVRVLRAGIGAGFAFVMVVTLFIDLDHFLILDRLTIPSLVIFYALGIFLPERGWQDGLVGAATGLVMVRVIADLFLLIRGKVGMGGGDAKLLAVIGALMGWKAPIVAVFLGTAVALAVLLPSIAIRSARGKGGDDEGAAEEPPEAPLPWARRKDALYSLAIIAAIATAVVTFGLPIWIASIALIVLAFADDFLELTDTGPVIEEDDDPDDDLTTGAVPFGPFLAVAALFWWFAEPYVMWKLRHP